MKSLVDCDKPLCSFVTSDCISSFSVLLVNIPGEKWCKNLSWDRGNISHRR
uniref:Uncharacterized protein n=1 Tax=Octopus bimaculoides TaxID=37653 RepID=A0A0L8FTY9_OCTBM